MDQARLAQEYANLASVYDPQRALIQQQISALPQQYEGQKSALEQAKINAFRNIGEAAQTRGTFFSGFRPQEMARYTGEKYLPALANLGTQQQQATFNLQKALADVELAQRQVATTNLQNVLNREQQQRQFEQQLALARASAAGSGGGSPTFDLGGLINAMQGGGQPTASTGPSFTKTASGKGYNFFDVGGKPISAIQFAQQSGRGGDIKNFLQSLADGGDANARIAIQYADSNFRNVPVQYKNALQALGIGSASYVSPQPTPRPGAFTPAIRGIGSFK